MDILNDFKIKSREVDLKEKRFVRVAI